MKRFDIPLFSDTLFCSFTLWYLCLCFLRFYKVEKNSALGLSIFFALSAGFLIFIFLYYRKKKKFLIGKDKETLEKLRLHLALLPDKEIEELFLDTAEQNACFLFTLDPVTQDDVGEKIKSKKGQSFKLYCNELTLEAQKLCNDFSIQVMDIKKIFPLLKEQKRLPEKFLYGEKVKKTWKERIKFPFRKSNGKAFFTVGAMLLFLSLFSFFPVYYFIFGSILTLTSLIIRLFGYA